MHKRVRLASVVAFLAVVGMGVLGTARAEGPEPFFGICAFPITHEFPKEHVSWHQLPSSSAPFDEFVTGQVLVRITNVTNGRSVEVHANSATFFLRDGTAMFRGQSVTFFDTNKGHVPAGVWVINGNVHITFDQDGRVATVEGGILRRNICAELA